MEGFAMSDAILQAVQQSQLKTDLPVVSVGDTIDVHVRIIEGVKERIQVFTGVVIKRQNSGLEETITVRRIVANEGVERTFPINSPRVAKIEIVRHGHTRRSKLYYLRDRVGKKRRLRDRKSGLGWLNEQQGKADTARAESQAKEKAAAEAGKAEE
jgi:large subunit ribosomal protein L19